VSARWCDGPDSPRLPTEGVPRPPTAAERVRGVAAPYDADGDLATESLPGGYTLTVGEDETGAMTSRVYTRDRDSAVVASDTVDRSVQD
jgi:hypothetical protein